MASITGNGAKGHHKFTLTVTESSYSVANNTSSVSFSFQLSPIQKEWDWYDWTDRISYSITINGTYYTGYIPAYDGYATVTLKSGTLTVAHNADGAKTISYSFSVTDNTGQTYTSGNASASGSLALTTIPRAATITSAAAVTLGNKCAVNWTPASASFRYKIKFSIGNWSYTTGAIHPNTTASYTYNSYTIPLEAAHQMPNVGGSMTATLYTYSDSAATKQIGSASSKTFMVTLPNNASTKPSVAIALTPVNTHPNFDGMYIQGKTKVKGVVSAIGNYSATISSSSFTVEGETYASNATSDYITGYGNLTVSAKAVDSRKFEGTASAQIYVHPYSNPKIVNDVCERCDSNGNASDTGTYLKIAATRNYTDIMLNGVQKNFCEISYRYKADGGGYTPWTTLLSSTDTSTDKINAILLNGALSKTTAYTVQVRVTDTIGGSATSTYDIESEEVYAHRRKDALGLGKHTSGSKLLDVGWDANFDGKVTAKTMMLTAEEITVGGDLNTYYPVHIKPLYADNSYTFFLGLGKMLGTTSPAWSGNHTNGTSSIAMGWMYRYNGWDGSGHHIETLYKCEEYAKLIAHVSAFDNAAKGVALYLRGGGATYKITSNIPIEISVYLESTNVSETAGNTVTVSPREYTGNYGIFQVNAVTSDFIVETGTSGIWTYRKWYSGLAECWGKKTGTITNIAKVWGNLYVGETYIDRVQYPFTFTSAPNEQAKVYTQTSAVILFAESAGSGVNTTTHTAMYNIARGNAVSTSVQYTIDYYVTGRYK